MTKIGPLFDSAEEHSPETRRSLQEAIRICERLRASGHVAYLAGGCVRDALLGREPKDFDVATDATPDRVRQVFGRANTLAFGASFGVIGVLPENSSSGEHFAPTEVATFRSDGEYSDGRRPDKVHFGDAKHDALRRDFTINGLFFDPAVEQVIDFVGGHDDLKAGLLRTIGSAKERFEEEDKLRMLRAARFATTLGFRLDPEAEAEILSRAEEIRVVSAERIGAEMRRIVTSKNAFAGLQLIDACGLDRVILPALRSADFDRMRQLLDSRSSLDFESSMALILLAMSPEDAGNSYQKLVKQMESLWRLSSEETRRLKAAMTHWKTIAEAHDRPWSVVQPILVDRDVDVVLSVAETIVRADRLQPAGVVLCRKSIALPADVLDPPPLITGQTLTELGHRPGPDFKVWLGTVREAQLNGEIATEAEALALLRKLTDGDE